MDVFTLRSASGIEVDVIPYGGIITAIRIPDRPGTRHNIVLGYDSLTGYQTGTSYFGAVIGRYANRIAGARFSLDGAEYQLAANDGHNHLHGGPRGFHAQMWATTIVPEGIELTRISPDGEEGYPGALEVAVRYTLTDNDAFRIDYRARTSRPTVINLTQHTYFNLAGAEATIADHLLTIHADAYTPVDGELIPTGEVAAVDGTHFDFRHPRRIGDTVDYDHNWVLNGSGLRHVATLADPASGRKVEVHTTEPGLQFYCGHLIGRRGLCLETQHFPDSPHHGHFPSTVLRPSDEFRSTTIWRL